MKLSDNAEYILEQRYLLRDKQGNIKETPEKMLRRVAKAVASVESSYGKNKQEIKKIERSFYKIMNNMEFLPNSPTLMNAGTSNSMLSACYTLTIEDSLEDIFEKLKTSALIYKMGGGVGFSFSKLRPKDDLVVSTGGTSSGPVSFMSVYDAMTGVTSQGGKRRGAGLATLRCDHPDIMDFIVAKDVEGAFKNFNFSVIITDKFMNAVKNNIDFDLINPRTKKVVKSIKAKALWNLLCTMSWKNGEPGLIFIDTINKYNPVPEIPIESLNPCGESNLISGEACNLGSINLSKFYKKHNCNIDYKKLREVVRLAVRFLDNVIDANKFPTSDIQSKSLSNRKIGLGIMGFADLLMLMGIRYDSNKALEIADKVMSFINKEGFIISQELGKEKGSFPNKSKSIYKNLEHLRNATITAIAPTGTLSLCLDCSASIEPIFSVVQVRHVEDTIGKNLIEINSGVKKLLENKGLWNDDIQKTLTEGKNKCLILPKSIKDIIVTAHEVSPEWHVKMQAAFQKHVHQSISKTVNLPNDASILDVEDVYLMAYSMLCKGTTVYRNGSRSKQLLTISNCIECEAKSNE